VYYSALTAPTVAIKMADVIKCPVCGESNLPDQEFCQYCQTRLEPLTGLLKGADAPIKPGQMPTKKSTADLEPILPQWLRDARDSARKSAEDESTPEERRKQESFSASTSSFDLLAGLQSQKESGEEDDEEIPDWLTSITGNSSKSINDKVESSEVRWVELGGANDFAQEEKPEVVPDAPSWLADKTPAESQSNEKDDLNNWFRDASGSQTPEQPQQPSASDDFFAKPPAPSDTPDWLRQMVADTDAQNAQKLQADSGSAPSFSESPAWLKDLSAEDDAQKAGNTFGAASDASLDEPDWLRSLGGTQDQAQSAGPPAFSGTGPGAFEAPKDSSSDEGLPAWMQSLPPVESDKPKQGTVPNWLKEETPAASTGKDLPSWLSGLPASEPEPEPEQQPTPSEDNATFGDIPDWLKAAAPQSSIYSDQSEEQATASASDSDWLNTFKSIDSTQPQSAPAFSTDETVNSAPSAFTPDAQASYNMDELFTELPDWLSKATDNPNVSTPPSVAASADSLAAGELPSWVQAMRPVDSGHPLDSLSSDQTLESRGALAGLQGVLPAVPGYVTSSKPKAYSIKLRATEEQQAQAELLEQILAAETEPVPIASFSLLPTSSALRWVITFIFFAVLLPILLIGTQIFAMPVGSSREIDGAVQVVQSIPEGAPVLVAFDYEPARVGEMEAAAAPIFDLLQNSSLTFISTNETGGILAERFISGSLAGLSGEGSIQYLNLGYLPGGQMGIRAFAQNPPSTTPLDVTLSPAWESPQLQGITSLSQFAALIIVTDNANSARAWIEQTSAARGKIPVVVISSAQAAPMIQPYFDSQQVSGLVTGLYGGAVVEQKNGTVSGTTRRYWDAYSIGMLLAMIFILGGGLLNLALGLRDRAAAREAK
jgi:hypothetical protein